jgi:hypothetical protein
MREDITSIPVTDIFDEPDGCPICRLRDLMEARVTDYITGAAMMEPDVRIETNKTGFCQKHFADMLAMPNRLSLALMLQSYLGDLLEKGISDKKHISKKDFEEISEKLTRSTNGCFVCESISSKLKLYARNIIYIWESTPEFREKTRAQEYFCPRHLALLTETAKGLVSKRNYKAFCEDHFSVTRGILEGLKGEVDAFCNSYNYLYRDIPLGEAKLAAEHTIDFLGGDSDDE